MPVDKKLIDALYQHNERKAKRQARLGQLKAFLAACALVGAVLFLSGCTAARADAVARFMFWPQQNCDAYIDGNPDGCVYGLEGRLYNAESTK